jgi:hypothetical protein
MKNENFVWVGILIAIVIAVGGIFLPQANIEAIAQKAATYLNENLGAVGTRFPNGISADSTAPVAGEIRGDDLTLDDDLVQNTTNTATTTAALGCIQTTATSTATAIKLVFGNGVGVSSAATTTFSAPAIGLVAWSYGTCP